MIERDAYGEGRHRWSTQLLATAQDYGFIARASATCYSLVETAKTNSLEPSAYIQHVLKRIAEADTLEKLEALLPWNVDLERTPKKVSQRD
jgi:hypothetical protein